MARASSGTSDDTTHCDRAVLYRPGMELAGAAGFVLLAVFGIGWAIRIVGQLRHRSYWKIGLRLYAAAIAALPIVGGVAILAIPYGRFGDLWWLSFLFIPMGLVTIAVGILAVGWIARASISDSRHVEFGPFLPRR